ncbi:UNC93-like protein MFSD11 [Ixodes scapularis]
MDESLRQRDLLPHLDHSSLKASSAFCPSFFFSIFIAQFLVPVTWGLYAASVAIGFGAALIWTGQGNFLTINSNSTTMSRNSGIFWAMLQCSLIWGNIFVYVQFQGLEHIDKATRTTVFGALTGVGILGMLLILILRGGGLPSRSLAADSPEGDGGPPSVVKPAGSSDFVQALGEYILWSQMVFLICLVKPLFFLFFFNDG